MKDMLQVGVITSPHGVHGEVKVYPTTDDVKRFKKLKTVTLDSRKGPVEAHVKSVKFFKNMVILGFEEYETMDDAATLRQCPILVDRKNAVKLEKDEYFIADLIDFEVTDSEKNLHGILKDVFQTGANDVYDIRLDDGREVLIPAIKECILEVDTDNRIMSVNILDGLLD